MEFQSIKLNILHNDVAKQIEKGKPLAEVCQSPKYLKILGDIPLRINIEGQKKSVYPSDQAYPAFRGHVLIFTGSEEKDWGEITPALINEINGFAISIDLATIVSKYIGDAPMYFQELFKAAEELKTILFFDEADALFGKRSGGRDANDRFSKSDKSKKVEYLRSSLIDLIESYSGLVVISTRTLPEPTDKLMKIVDFVLEFPIPR